MGKIPWRRAWQLTLVFLPEKSPWAEEPGRLQSMGPQRIRYSWVTKHARMCARAHTHTHTHTHTHLMCIFPLAVSVFIYFLVFRVFWCQFLNWSWWGNRDGGESVKLSGAHLILEIFALFMLEIWKLHSCLITWRMIITEHLKVSREGKVVHLKRKKGWIDISKEQEVRAWFASSTQCHFFLPIWDWIHCTKASWCFSHYGTCGQW